MKREAAQQLVTKLLLAFVLVSIGFALGKEFARRSAAPTSEPADASRSRVIVYYMHATIRCVTCNTIEKMARDLITTRFADALQDGRLEWKEVNYQENDDLAKRYAVASSTVVVVRAGGGEAEEFKNLEKVWELYQTPEKFNEYVGAPVAEFLGGLK